MALTPGARWIVCWRIEHIEIAAISVPSAGAMCAVVVADGFEEGGAEGARKQLRQFWEGVARAGKSNPYRRTPMMAFLNAFKPGWAQESYLALWADVVTRVASPYDFNPLNVNPLKEVLGARRFRACAPL